MRSLSPSLIRKHLPAILTDIQRLVTLAAFSVDVDDLINERAAHYDDIATNQQDGMIGVVKDETDCDRSRSITARVMPVSYLQAYMTDAYAYAEGRCIITLTTPARARSFVPY